MYPYKYPYSDMYSLNLDWIIDTINKLKVEIESSGVQSVNGKAGIVTLTGTDVPFSATNSLPISEVVTAADSAIIRDYNEKIENVWTYGVGDTDNLGAENVVAAFGNLDNLTVPNAANLVSAVNTAYTIASLLDTRVGALASLQTADKTSVVNAINSVLTTAAQALTSIGVLSLLTTTDKSSVVAAINEVRNTALTGDSTLTAAVQAMAQKIGTLEDLQTTVKTSLVLAINEVLSRIVTVDGKVGNLADLNTSTKLSIVNAVNEVLQFAGVVNTRVGALADLSTTNKTSIVGAINEINANLDAAGSLTFTVPVTATGINSYTVTGLTDQFVLADAQFFDSNSDAVPSFADVTLTSGTNSLTVNVSAVSGTGTLRLTYINSTHVSI